MRVLLQENSEEHKFTLGEEIRVSYEKDGELVFKCVKAILFFKMFEVLKERIQNVESLDLYTARFYIMQNQILSSNVFHL
mgnify:CR=1 FL=1